MDDVLKLAINVFETCCSFIECAHVDPAYEEYQRNTENAMYYAVKRFRSVDDAKVGIGGILLLDENRSLLDDTMQYCEYTNKNPEECGKDISEAVAQLYKNWINLLNSIEVEAA